MSNPGPGPDGRPPLAIGELARRAGKRPSSIRYYEQIGLLPPPARVDGRRRYDPGTVRTLAVIDTAQRAGLSLDEIRLLLSASPDDSSAVDRLRAVAERKLPEINALIERTELVRGWLECAARCECPDLSECPLFDHPALLCRVERRDALELRVAGDRGAEMRRPDVVEDQPRERSLPVAPHPSAVCPGHRPVDILCAEVSFPVFQPLSGQAARPRRLML